MVNRLVKEKIQKSAKSVLLLGPRQVGKSTLLSSLKPDLIINLARQNEFLRYSSEIDLFSEQIEGSNAKLIFIDEIQRIPDLLNTIQAIIDEGKAKNPIRFLLSGSSARKLRRGQANLLPGRIFSYQMAGLALAELNYQAKLERALKYGFLPEPFFEKNQSHCEKLLDTYSATYLHEEIQAEALTRNIQGFARFLILLGSQSGQILDFSKIAKRAKVSRTSCVRFIEILEDTLIADRVTVFDEIVDADVIKHPKLYFFDVGVLNGLMKNFNVSIDRKGVLFENLIYSQIRNSALAWDIPFSIQYFRTRHGTEVDFIVKIAGKVWAIEVKAGAIESKDLNGLRSFREYYPQVHKCILVTPNEKRRTKDGILICDWITMIQEMGL